MFLLIPAYPGCPGQTAVKWLLVVVVVVCVLPMAVAQSYSGGIAIPYVFPVFTDKVIFAHNAPCASVPV